MTRARTLGLFLLTTVAFGAAFPAVKVGLSVLPPLLFVAARSVVSAALLLAYARLSSGYWLPRTRADRVAVLAAGVFMIGGAGFGFVGQQFVTAGVAAVVFSLSPVVTALVAWALLPAERLSGRDYVAVLVGLVGAAVVVSPDPAALLDPTLAGKLLVLLAVVVTALGAVLVRRTRPTLPVPALTGWGMVVGGAVNAAGAVAVGESVAAVRPTLLAAAAVAYLGVVAGGVGFVAYLTLLDRVGPLKANLTTYLTPVVAVVVGWAALGETVQPATVVGFLVIVAGFALLERREVVAELAGIRGVFR